MHILYNSSQKYAVIGTHLFSPRIFVLRYHLSYNQCISHAFCIQLCELLHVIFHTSNKISMQKRQVFFYEMILSKDICPWYNTTDEKIVQCCSPGVLLS